MDRMYICIDLKSFFASVEAVERKLDPMTTNLVVADASRGDGTICLAITPALKALGVRNRCRLYEVPKGIDFIIAPPRMRLYMDYSTKIFSIYMRYVSPDDIHVYSIDECFIDVTQYLKIYNLSSKGMAQMLMDAVLKETGISATAGIGTNLFLAKVALDVTAKHVKDRIGYLDEDVFKETIWHHRPITDIWNVGPGIARRLERIGVEDLFGVAHTPESILYKEFGVNAEFLIDHSWGREPCTIEDIHNYKSTTMSLSNSQILFDDYNAENALIVLKEMIDLMVLELVDKHVVTDNISLGIGYSKDIIKATGCSRKIDQRTNSYKVLSEYFVEIYNETVRKDFPIRKISISFNNLLDEDYATFSMFSDAKFEKKENLVQKAVIDIKKKYGKNAILKANSFKEKATGKLRNTLIGGHNSGEE